MGQTVYHFVHQRKKRNTAGSKAPEDVTKICNDLGFRELLMPPFPGDKHPVYKKAWLLTVAVRAWQKACRRIPEGAELIFQHPSYGMRLSRKYLRRLKEEKHCRLIALIHDLESLRGGIAGVMSANTKTNSLGDGEFLKLFDAVICHNEHMRQYLISQGFGGDRLINLEIFDYLSDAEPGRFEKGETPSVAIAGNLAFGKCSYIYKILNRDSNRGLTIHLYGNNFEESRMQPGMIHHGSFSPEELAEHLTGDFGLVWDGPEAETCAGNTGEYLRYNNPHKTSLYLSAGMPVAVWRQAAISDFVLSRGAGIAVDSLYELSDAVSRVSREEYNRMRDNALEISKELRSGFYTRKALEKALAGNE